MERARRLADALTPVPEQTRCDGWCRQDQPSDLQVPPRPMAAESLRRAIVRTDVQKDWDKALHAVADAVWHHPRGREGDIEVNLAWNDMVLLLRKVKYRVKVTSSESHITLSWTMQPGATVDALSTASALRCDFGSESVPTVVMPNGMKSKTFERRRVIEAGDALALIWDTVL